MTTTAGTTTEPYIRPGPIGPAVRTVAPAIGRALQT